MSLQYTTDHLPKVASTTTNPIWTLAEDGSDARSDHGLCERLVSLQVSSLISDGIYLLIRSKAYLLLLILDLKLGYINLLPINLLLVNITNKTSFPQFLA